jgi:archaellin
MIFIIAAIIVAAVAAFLILRPNPSGTPADSTAQPASQQ